MRVQRRELHTPIPLDSWQQKRGRAPWAAAASTPQTPTREPACSRTGRVSPSQRSEELDRCVQGGRCGARRYIVGQSAGDHSNGGGYRLRYVGGIKNAENRKSGGGQVLCHELCSPGLAALRDSLKKVLVLVVPGAQ